MVVTVHDPEQAGVELAAQVADLTAAPDAPVVDVLTLAAAVRDRDEIGRMVKQIEAYFAPLKGSAYKLWRDLCGRENAVRDPLLVRDRERALAISAFKAAEDVRRREAERVEAERRQREQERHAVAEAAQLEQQGDGQLAAAVLAEAISAPAPVVVLPDVTKQVERLKFVRRWHYRVSNEALVPREYLQVDEKKLGGFARSMKASAKVPGVEFYFTDEPVR